MEFYLVLVSLVYYLKRWPELWAAFLCSLSAIWYFKTKNQVIVNWPVLGALPSLLCNAHRQMEWHVEVFNSLSTNTFTVKGPKLKYLITCHPGNVEYILKTNFSNFPKGKNFRDIFDILGDGMFTVDSEQWRIQRKMGHSRFTSREFRSLIANTAKKVVEDDLIPLLANVARLGSIINLQEIFISFSLKSNEIAVTGSMDYQDDEIAEAMDNAQEALIHRVAMPPLLWKFLRWLNVEKERNLAKAKKIIDVIIGKHILAKRENLLKGVRTNDLLSMFMTSQEGERKDLSESHKFLRDTTLTLFTAGRDTTASGLTWFFWLISQNPHAEAKIFEELKLVFLKKKEGEGSLNIKRLWVFNSDDLKGLVYLNAALHESLRLYPPLPLNRKEVIREDVLPDGTIVRPGMHVLFSIYAMGRMTNIWGEDSLEFKPERWLNEVGELRHELTYKYFVFNAGPRTCLGKDMALTLMKSAAAAILFNFHVEVVEGHRVSYKPGIILHMKNGLLVNIRERAAWC